jgi:hypothetical protein
MTQSATGRVTEYSSFESKGEKRPDQPTLDGHEFAYGPWLSLDTAFVAGCLWGDDSTWKLEVIDLSRAAEGIIPRSARFGHVQLGKMPLAEAVWLDSNSPHPELRASIIRQERRDIRSGALIDPDDEQANVFRAPPDHGVTERRRHSHKIFLRYSRSVSSGSTGP